jgi:isoleucyl-tRNA synthetase
VGPAATNTVDKDYFYATGYEVLVTLAKILAPFTPFLAEEIFKNLSEEESVHLQDWPVTKENLIDNELEEKMEFVREVCVRGHAKRKEEGIKVRQPLRKVEIRNWKLEIGEEFLNLIKEELNVKEVVITKKEGELTVSLDTTITAELKEEGEAREIIRQIQELRKQSGCGLTDYIEAGLPSWPKAFEEEIKRKTLAKTLYISEKMEINHHASAKEV